MRRFDIYNAAVEWKDCRDDRPWLVVELRCGGEVAACFPFSGEDYTGISFPVHSSHADFEATGLAKSCYIYDESFVELSTSSLTRFRGKLAGALLASFREHAGLD